jgi:hypothetical protein
MPLSDSRDTTPAIETFLFIEMLIYFPLLKIMKKRSCTAIRKTKTVQSCVYDYGSGALGTFWGSLFIEILI